MANPPIGKWEVGTVLETGVTILELLPDRKSGGRNRKWVRCKCPVCNNENWEVRADNVHSGVHKTCCRQGNRQNVLTDPSDKEAAYLKQYLMRTWRNMKYDFGMPDDYPTPKEFVNAMWPLANPRPSYEHELELIDKDRPVSPDNVHWVYRAW